AVILAAAGQDGVAMTNTGYDELSRAITVEVLLTAVFVWVIMAVTRQAGSHVDLTIGLTLVMVHLGRIPFSGASVHPPRSFGPAVCLWLIMAVARKARGHVPLPIGLTLVMVHLAGIPFSGASVNPPRSFGPAVISGEFTNIGVYLYAPLIGGLIAAVLYRLFPVKDD